MTAQFLERLHHRGETVGMVADPLAVYFEMGGRNPGFQSVNTAIHRGYIGQWRITSGRLYLEGITGVLADRRPASLAAVFPGFAERVFAHWFSGVVRIPRGKILRYAHSGFDSVFERDEMIEFERGVLVGAWMRRNGSAPSGSSGNTRLPSGTLEPGADRGERP